MSDPFQDATLVDPINTGDGELVDSGGCATGSLPPSIPANLTDALQICRKIEEAVAPYGFHAALGGGVIHKQGERKDVDIILWPDDRVEKTLVYDPRPWDKVVEAVTKAVAPEAKALPLFNECIRVIPGDLSRPRIDLFFTRRA